MQKCTVLGRNLFSIANDCNVNLSKMLVKKQMKYFDVPLDHAWKVEEEFDDYVITEDKCYVMSNDQCCLFVHNFAYFSLFFWKPVFKKIYVNNFKLHHLYMYLYLCVWINLYNNNMIINDSHSKTIQHSFKGTVSDILEFPSTMPDSQLYPWNLCLFNNVEDIVVWLV